MIAFASNKTLSVLAERYLVCLSRFALTGYYFRSHPSGKTAPGKVKMTARMPDDKVKERDLYFTPEQSFDDETTAKHACALLALFHFEPLRPHERRLPEPYRTMWMSLNGAKDTKGDTSIKENKELAVSFFQYIYVNAYYTKVYES